MSDKFNRIVESFFHQKENILGALELQTLLEQQFKRKLLNEKSKTGSPIPAPQTNQTKQKGTRTITYNSIADIAVSELGWAGLNTTDTGVVDDSKRAQLEQYLKNISGNTFDEKIKAINSFYTASMEDLIKTGVIKASSRTEKIQQMLSYLVFLKTLTTIITNFNASAAGFAFEAFLGVLLNGRQIPASGATTIADVTIEEGGETVYASLKLYAESSLEVGGSFRDLVNDMVDPKKPFIRYITGLKSLSGKALDMEGRVTFHKFDINIDNVMNIMGSEANSKHSRACVLLPKEYIRTRGAKSFETQMTLDIDPKQIYSKHIEILNKNLGQVINKRFTKLSAEQKNSLRQSIVNIVLKHQKENESFFAASKKKELGYTTVNARPLKQVFSDIVAAQKEADTQTKLASLQEILIDAISNSYSEVVRYVHSATSPEAKEQAMDKIVWAKTSEECVEFYNSLSKQEKAKALKNTLGYLRQRQFSMSKTQMFAATDTGKEKIGEIIIGKKSIQELLNKIGGELDDSVFEIFEDLAKLTQNINKYFATGLQDDTAADTAQEAALSIDKKTEEVQTKK